MVRSYFQTCAATVVALGLTATATAGYAGTAEAPATESVAPGAPAAAVVSAGTAASLAATIDTGLRQWFPPTGATAVYRWDGLTAVTAAGDHYDVNLPSLQITGDDGSRAQIGVIRLALTPNSDGSWGVGLAVPPRIALLAANGAQEGEVTLGSQRFLGRWLPVLGTFVKADGSFGDLTATSSKDATRLEIGAVTLRTDLSEQPPGRWTGPSNLVISKLTMVDEHGVQVASLGRAAFEATVTGMDIAHAITLGTEPGPAPVAGKQTKEGAQAAVRRHLAMLHNLLGGASAKLRVEDLTTTAPADGSVFTIGQITLNGGIEGLDQGKSTVKLGYEHAGFKVEPSPGPREFTPESVKLAVAVADLPNAGLWTAFEKMFQPAPGQPDDQAGTVFAQQAQAALTQAGSRLRIEALNVVTPATSATLKGEAQFSAQAPLGMIAGFDMIVRGLDAAVKNIQPAQGGKADEDTQNTLAMLSMLQLMGAPGKDESGRDSRSYKLELGVDGKVMLNGADMSALLQGGQSTEPKPDKGNGAAPGHNKAGGQ